MESPKTRWRRPHDPPAPKPPPGPPGPSDQGSRSSHSWSEEPRFCCWSRAYRGMEPPNCCWFQPPREEQDRQDIKKLLDLLESLRQEFQIQCDEIDDVQLPPPDDDEYLDHINRRIRRWLGDVRTVLADYYARR